MKKLMAMALAATLAFGSSVMVFADTDVDADVVDDTVIEEVEGEEEVEEVEEAEVEVAPEEEPVVEPVAEPVAFTGEEKEFLSTSGETVGKYVSFSNNESLTATMRNLVSDTYQEMLVNGNLNPAVSHVLLVVDYAVEETNTAAKIEYSTYTVNPISADIDATVIATYYVDKATNAEITAEAYAASVEPVVEEEPVVEGEPVVEEEPVAEEPVESVMLPLRATAESLGYVVDWQDGKVTVSKDDAVVLLEAGSTTYINAEGEEVELEAPENIDGTLYVPQEFFTVILGVEVNVEGAAPVAPAEVVTEDETLEEGEEAPADEEAAEGEETPDEEAPVEEGEEGDAADEA